MNNTFFREHNFLEEYIDVIVSPPDLQWKPLNN